MIRKGQPYVATNYPTPEKKDRGIYRDKPGCRFARAQADPGPVFGPRAGVAVGSTTCGHLPKIVARRVCSRLPPPPPSRAGARAPGLLWGNPEFFRGFQVLLAGAGAAPEKRDTPGARWQPVSRRSSREPGFVVRVGTFPWHPPAEGGDGGSGRGTAAASQLSRKIPVYPGPFFSVRPPPCRAPPEASTGIAVSTVLLWASWITRSPTVPPMIANPCPAWWNGSPSTARRRVSAFFG